MDIKFILYIRYGLIGTLFLFSLVALGLSGHSSSLSAVAGSTTPGYLSLDLAVAVITIVVIAPCIVIEIFREGAFTSLVAVEIGWSFVLMILWLAAAESTTAGANADAWCEFTGVCNEAQGLVAFAWLNFVILLGWLITLITLTIIAHARGNASIWTSPVRGTNFFLHKVHGQIFQPAGMRQQQQHIGAPVQQPAWYFFHAVDPPIPSAEVAQGSTSVRTDPGPGMQQPGWNPSWTDIPPKAPAGIAQV